MEIIYTASLNEEQKKQVFEILCETDREFIPPLSYREDTKQKNLYVQQSETKPPYIYFEKVTKQSNLLAMEEGHVVGFMSFEEDYFLELEEKSYETLYMSTLIVRKESRRKGISSRLYEELLKRFQDRNIITRTWSTNVSHIGLLEKLGFQMIECIRNDRGPGIDTVYYGRILGEKQ